MMQGDFPLTSPLDDDFSLFDLSELEGDAFDSNGGAATARKMEAPAAIVTPPQNARLSPRELSAAEREALSFPFEVESTTISPAEEPVARAFLEEQELNRNKDVVTGQGSKDQGMKMWIERTKDAAAAKLNGDKSNAKTLAKDIVKQFKQGSGRFIGNGMFKGDQELRKTKKYFEMSDDEAVELTVEALLRQYEPLHADKDVILGRGGAANHNHCNKVYREEIRNKQALYNDIPSGRGRRNEKTEMSREIVAGVIDNGGLFLSDENSIKGMYYVVSKEKAVHKTSQCLREKRVRKKQAVRSKASKKRKVFAQGQRRSHRDYLARRVG